MGKFDKYDGNVEFDFEGEHYKLRYDVQDAKEFVKISSKFKKTREVDMDAKIAYWLAVIARAYPDEDKEKVKNFLALNMFEFEKAFMLATGMVTQAKLDKFEENFEENFQKFAESMADSPAKNSA